MLLIFSDLDATLLDHNTYSFQEALPALQLIRKRKIPLILSSSKTYDEMIVIRKELNNHDPFIYENGSGIYFEDNKVSLGTSHYEISNLLQDLKKRFSFTSFNDLGPEGIQKETGLDIYASERAYRREFTEPLIWKDSTQNLIIFKQLLQQNNLTAAQGGRFLTISSAKNKGDALLWVKKRYESIAKVKITTIGLGDSENDINMLDCADNAIIVRHPKKLPPNINGHASLIITDAIGPKGWNEAIINILDEQ
ncbi:HAD-IIB family hydrolase [Methylophilaceae bacterium]|nr:HAD-IIB family hydrolase [Methylophilaceae bacterium]MDC1011142.1 HAD-IIB family hydrolase [Methylophilaceae bacterium]